MINLLTMELRLSDPLKLEDFQVTLLCFVGYETKWSEIQTAAR